MAHVGFQNPPFLGLNIIKIHVPFEADISGNSKHFQHVEMPVISIIFMLRLTFLSETSK